MLKKALKLKTRSFATMVEESNQSHFIGHPVYSKIPYKNYQELCDHLMDNRVELQLKKGMFVFNKPYGLKKVSNTDERILRDRIHSVPTLYDMNYLNFTDVLPYLEERLQENNLQILRMPERHTSGVSILASDGDVKARIEKAMRRSECLDKYTYLAVCVGLPVKNEETCSLGVKMELKERAKHNLPRRVIEKKAMFVETWRGGQARFGTIYPVHFRCKTVDYNPDLDCSLVRVSVQRDRHHSTRLYLATRMMAPILGDYMFGGRVRRIGGVSVLVDSFNPLADMGQKLTKGVLKALNLRTGMEMVLPTHLHLTWMKLPKFVSKKVDLIVHAPPPAYFQWTCQKLNLDIPENVDDAEAKEKLEIEGNDIEGNDDHVAVKEAKLDNDEKNRIWLPTY